MKKYLILGSLAYLGYQAFKVGSGKADTIKNTIQSLIVQIASVKNVSIVDGGLSFLTNLTITNPTSELLSLNAKELVTITKINFFTDSGQFLGEATPNITGINIPANSKISVTNVPTFVKVSNFGALLNNAIDLFLDPKKLKITTEITALGKTYTLG